MTLAVLAPALLFAAAPEAPPFIDAPPPPAALVAVAAGTPEAGVSDPGARVLQPAAVTAPPADPAQPEATPVETAPAEAVTPEPAPAASTATAATGEATHTPGDPFEKFNRRMFDAHEKFDRAILGPVAHGYMHAVPKPVRSGVHNMLVNLSEPIVFLNFLLQFKFGKAAETLARFAFNSTFGLGGMIDFAKQPGISLPHRPNGFGDTLGFYGVKPGPYLFLPFIGPTDVRDVLGGQIDGSLLPAAVGKPFSRLDFLIPYAIISGIDQRADADADLKSLFATSVDPYATLRSSFLQDRAGEIAALKGRRAASPMDEDLVDPDAKTATPSSTAPELRDPMADPDVKTQAPAQDGSATPSAPAKAGAPELGDPMTDPAAPASR